MSLANTSFFYCLYFMIKKIKLNKLWKTFAFIEIEILFNVVLKLLVVRYN